MAQYAPFNRKNGSPRFYYPTRGALPFERISRGRGDVLEESVRPIRFFFHFSLAGVGPFERNPGIRGGPFLIIGGDSE